MHRVALVVNVDKPLALETGAQILQWLEERKAEVLLHPSAAAPLGRPDLAVPEGPGWAQSDLVIVLGGDGTLIRAVQRVAPYGVPVLGINTGHLGFLTAMENGEALARLDRVLAGEYVLEERVMLRAMVERDGLLAAALSALNDAVISKGPRARMVHLEVSVGETTVARYPADGVIVATPTGSTAYSLSAGGPIVEPTVDCFLITPICPHTISARSMVVNADVPLAIRVVSSPGEVGLSADGSDPFPLVPGDVVRVGRAPYPARLVRLPGYQFYDVLRKKLFGV
ncbi:NAD+ kinase [Symbiobacterium terraclitae]|uniref:NAD kinase n=1 Tax=Symbiobacterium terraclitae TaxID=557451 RepID=A0ABS4JQG6_9FIRM|nr:NAD(+)/NADH kinase [Symbiobacterium terraclitae]MBP2016699.1 NAD+ kinase [Symbiobacterium terraclitae]